MKKLEKEFIKKGFKYTQIKRRGSVAIFKQENIKVKKPLARYEVVQIKSHKGYVIGGSKIAAAEVYPGSTQWGLLGWTYIHLTSAEKRYKQLINDAK